MPHLRQIPFANFDEDITGREEVYRKIRKGHDGRVINPLPALS
jgi:hypothetical protein